MNKQNGEKKEALENEAALELAVKYLDYGYRTVKQMKDYLKKKGAGDPAVQYSILKLKEYNYINDFEYCRLYAEANTTKSGAYKIKFDLIKKGAEPVAIEEALAGIDDDGQEQAAFALAQKQANGKEITTALLQKISRYLHGRGFSWGIIKRVLSRVSNGSACDFEE